MRTTLEWPDPLFAWFKAKAAMKQGTLKQSLHVYVEQGFSEPGPSADQARRSARDLPALQTPLQQKNVTFSNPGLFELLES